MVPYELSALALAKAIGVPRDRIQNIVREKRAITADTALRLGRAFNTTPRFWMNLQARYDTETAEKDLRHTLKKIQPVVA